MSLKLSVFFHDAPRWYQRTLPSPEESPYPAITGSRSWGLPYFDGLNIATALASMGSNEDWVHAQSRGMGIVIPAVFEQLRGTGFAAQGRSQLMAPETAFWVGTDWIYSVYLLDSSPADPQFLLELVGTTVVDEDWRPPASWNLNLEDYSYGGRVIWWRGSPEDALNIFPHIQT